MLGVESGVTVRVHNPTPRTLRIVLRDETPETFRIAGEELAIDLPPFSRRALSYRATPLHRGRVRFGDVHVRAEGSARLGSWVFRIPATVEAKVYPDVLGAKRFDLATRLHDLRSLGFRSVRAVGGGGEFEQLREYVSGDPYRDLDWKSTAKRQRPITQVFQQERSQLITLAIDAGRVMATRMNDHPDEIPLTKLDHAIKAALLLAYVALRQGDRVGVIVFDDAVRAHVPAGRGLSQYRAILEALHAVQARLSFVDFRRLTEFVQVRVPKRSLFVLFSDLLDDAHARPLADHARALRRKHLPICVSLTDPVALRFADAQAPSLDALYRRAAAADLLADREAIRATLTKSGVAVVESSAADLAVATVNKYLEIKARHAL